MTQKNKTQNMLGACRATVSRRNLREMLKCDTRGTPHINRMRLRMLIDARSLMIIRISSDIEERLSPQINSSEKRVTVNFSRHDWMRSQYSRPLPHLMLAYATDNIDRKRESG